MSGGKGIGGGTGLGHGSNRHFDRTGAQSWHGTPQQALCYNRVMETQRSSRALVRWLIRTIWLPDGVVRRAIRGPCRGLRFYVTPALQRSIFYRAHEPAVVAFLRRHITPGMVCWNIGAHVGMHALLMGKRGGAVVAFEAWPANYVALCQNIALNRHLDVRAELLALSNRRGEVALSPGSDSQTHHLTGREEAPALSVHSTTVDAYAAIHAPPALMLIDVEGAELSVLTGARATLERHKPLLVVEHHGRDGALAAWLGALGYLMTVDRRHLFANGRQQEAT